MVSKVLVTAGIVLAYLWLTYVKRGPVYNSEKSLNGKTVLITGGNAGIGKATVIELAKRNARIIMASRNVKKSEKAKKEIIDLTGNNKITVMKLDLGNRESIQSFVKKFKKNEDNLDYLINNAGLLYLNGTNEEGINIIFNINHLGHFLLTNLLMDMMKAQAKQRPVRIINLTSVAYRLGSINEESIHFDAQNTKDLWIAYGNSKLANNLFTLELNRRYKDYGITSYAVHPGLINTELDDNLSLSFHVLVSYPTSLFIREPFYGAQTTMYCVLDDDVVEYSGGYFSDCAHTQPLSFAKDKNSAEYLWKRSLTLTGLV